MNLPSHTSTNVSSAHAQAAEKRGEVPLRVTVVDEAPLPDRSLRSLAFTAEPSTAESKDIDASWRTDDLDESSGFAMNSPLAAPQPRPRLDWLARIEQARATHKKAVLVFERRAQQAPPASPSPPAWAPVWAPVPLESARECDLCACMQCVNQSSGLAQAVATGDADAAKAAADAFAGLVAHIRVRFAKLGGAEWADLVKAFSESGGVTSVSALPALSAAAAADWQIATTIATETAAVPTTLLGSPSFVPSLKALMNAISAAPSSRLCVVHLARHCGALAEILQHCARGGVGGVGGDGGDVGDAGDAGDAEAMGDAEDAGGVGDAGDAGDADGVGGVGGVGDVGDGRRGDVAGVDEEGEGGSNGSGKEDTSNTGGDNGDDNGGDLSVASAAVGRGEGSFQEAVTFAPLLSHDTPRSTGASTIADTLAAAILSQCNRVSDPNGYVSQYLLFSPYVVYYIFKSQSIFFTRLYISISIVPWLRSSSKPEVYVLFDNLFPGSSGGAHFIGPRTTAISPPPRRSSRWGPPLAGE